jgi:hypothetical protein
MLGRDLPTTGLPVLLTQVANGKNLQSEKFQLFCLFIIATGVNGTSNTGGKFTAGVVDTSSKFATGDVDTGGAP